MTKPLCVFASFLVTCSCASVSNQVSDLIFIPHSASDKRAFENVKLEMKQYCAPADEFAFLGAVAPMVSDFATSFIEQTLTAEAQRYEASYSASASSSAFYCEADGEMGIQGLKLTRHVGPDGDHALSFCAIAMPLPNEPMFQVIPYGFSLDRTKTKVVAFDFLRPFGVELLNPWESLVGSGGRGLSALPLDSDIDLRVSMKLNAKWVAEGQFIDKDLQSQTWTYRGAAINSDVNYFASQGAQESCATIDAQALADFASTLDEGDLSSIPNKKYFPMVPVSVLDNGDDAESEPDAYPLGIFEIEIAVTEYDEFGERINEVGDTFQNNKGNISNSITNLLD